MIAIVTSTLGGCNKRNKKLRRQRVWGAIKDRQRGDTDDAS